MVSFETESTQVPIHEVSIERYDTDVSYESYYDTETLELLAHLIYCEQGESSYECLCGVGSVVINRVNSPYFPDTVYDVIYQKGQYTGTWWMWNRTPSEDAYRAAAQVLTTGPTLPEYVTGQGTVPCDGWAVYCFIDGCCFSYPLNGRL